MAEEIDYAGLMDLIRDSDVFSEVDHSTIKNRIASSLLSDPIIKESFVKSEIANAMKKLSELKTRKKFFVQDVLTPEQQRLLRNRHPDFDLDFSKAKFTLSHPFQRSQRKMFQEKCLFELKVKDISKPSKGYDVVIKDVGANPAIHIGDDRFHSCCPLLSTCDDRRRSAYLLQLQQFVPDQKTKRAYDAHCAGDSRVICQRKAQNCHIKAPILLFNHSAYDMTPSDIAAAMYSSGATVGKGVIHFHPMVFYETSGVFPHGMHFRRFRNSSGTEKIRFFFENDNQRGYGHDYANYLRLVRMFVITHKTDRTHYFNVEFEGQNNDDCMYFTIYACRNGVVPRSTEFRVITDETLRDKVVLYYWQWRTLNPGTFLNFVKDKIRPKRLIVPRKLYELLYSYTATLTDQKLTVKNIIRAAQAFNTREIISGQSVKVPDPISPENLIHVSHAVFLLVYIKNYECSQVLSKLIEQETYVRTKSSSNFVSRFISNRVLAFTEKFRPSARHEAILKTVVPSDDCCATTEGYKSLFQYFKIDGIDDSMLEIKRQFNVVVQEKSVHFVTIEDEIENLCAANDPHMRGFTNPSAFENLDPQLIRSVINEHLPLEEPATNLLDVDAFVTSACAASGSFREISNDSNGDCAFQSAIDLGLYDQTPFEFT